MFKKSKYIIAIIFLYLLYKNKYTISHFLLPSIKENVVPDIIISPGGRFGIYNLGICHYIKNHFNIEDKKIVGFSAGSWNALFMCLKKEHMNEIIKKTFINKNKQSKSQPIYEILNNVKTILKEYNIEEFNIKNLYIATSHFNRLSIYNHFLTLDEIIRCCTSSSFIPFLTYKDLFYLYKNKLSFDGGIYYKKYIKKILTNNNPLIISFRMFGRHKNERIGKELFRKIIPSSYQLYIKGYHDASINHNYFLKYLS